MKTKAKLKTIKEILEFYANEKNYKQTEIVGYDMASKTELDRGSKAKYALKILKK